MKILRQEREVLESFMPGFDDLLRSQSFGCFEAPGNPGFDFFRRVKGPGLLIPEERGGLGGTLVDCARILRAVASRSPSTAIGVTMHLTSVLSLVEAGTIREDVGPVLEMIAESRLLLASAHAEGRPGSAFDRPSMTAARVEDGFLLSGRKQPCSLSRSMDAAAVIFGIEAGEEGNAGRFRAHTVVGADTKGVGREPFWMADILGGAESDTLVFDEVFVPNETVTISNDWERLDAEETAGLVSFQVLAASAYLGMLSALVEMTIARARGTARQRAAVVGEVELLARSIEQVATSRGSYTDLASWRAEAFAMRRLATKAIPALASKVVQLLGGLAFVRDRKTSYLLAACHALPFHPPSDEVLLEAIGETWESTG